MNSSALSILRCVNCTSPALVEQKKDKLLVCSNCKHSYPIKDGVPLMLDRVALKKFEHEDALKKFEHQWEIWGDDDVIYGKTSEQFEDRWMKEFKNPKLDKAWFKGKKALDAGCGHGIMVEVFDRIGADAVGVDLGGGIFSARRRIKNKNILLVQGDVMAVPFQPATFDYVYSNGVVHHTSDPRAAFKQLAALVKQGGSMDLWLYPKKGFLWEFTMNNTRRITSRLPPRMLSGLAHLMVPLLYVVPTWSRTHPRTHTRKQCAQVIYNWLSPRYQYHLTYEQVKKWYEEEGFTVIGQVKKTPLAVYGIKK